MAALFGVSRFLGIAANNCANRVGATFLANRQFASRRTVPSHLPMHRPPPQEKIYRKLPWIPLPLQDEYKIQEPTTEELKLVDGVVENVNELVTTDNVGRLFAVVHICGKQFKVTENDVVVIQGYWPPNPGDQLKLEKVLLVGGTDFSLIGRPILNRELVTVDATIIEKTFSHTKTRFRMRPRKQYKRFHFYRIQHTMVRINSININRKIDEKKEVEGLDRIY